ncbi:MAG: hypothetical protein II944_02215, partial [Ruminobacter sp.]|nr:hypothetical protein [Ruminobacter sp.]
MTLPLIKQGDEYVYKYYKYVNRGWNLEDRAYDQSADKKTFKYTGTYTYTEYKNSITGETSFDRNALNGKGYTLTEKVNDYPAKAKVYTGGVAYIKVKLGSGNIKLKKVKSSNKKVIKAKIASTEENITTDKYNFSKDTKGYYYKSNVTEDKIYVSSPTEVVNESNATVYIKVYGVKDGKATVSFDIYDVNGTKTGKGKVTVYSDKKLPITDITYGGQSLEQGVKI